MNVAKILLLAVIGFTITVGLQAADAATPDAVVRDYIEAFRKKDKAKMFSCLNETFFEEFKSQYAAMIEAYSDEKKKALLRLFGVDNISVIKAMNGRVIFSTVLDTLEAETYWRSFDSVALTIEVETMRISGRQALVRSFMSVKENLTAKVETDYTLVQTDKGWEIERFKKRIIRPNKAPEPTHL